MIQHDEFFMKEALIEAKKAYDLDEVPVGAVLVYEGEIIARGYNQMEMLKDATAHAEMICLKAAAAVLDNWRLNKTILFCTLEPCCMCAGAMILSRIDTLVWGARDHRHGAHGSWTDVFDKPHPIHNLQIRSGVLQEESSKLMRDFFLQKRTNARISI